MAERIADRPHVITILLSILAALISALGVYLAYEKSIASPPPESVLAPGTDRHRQTPEEAAQEEAKRKQSLEEAALETARKNVLGLWTCTAADPKKIWYPEFDVSVYADNTLDIYNLKGWPDPGGKNPKPADPSIKPDTVPYRFLDSTHVQVEHILDRNSKNPGWDTYTIGLMADKSSQRAHSDNDDQITCTRK
jgi:hypothetical protein